ncbi:MAG: GAF domain-containing protein [candidate division NC10 bacterium]|nr:GAF domain-containing protein [candidate division NC10 bacterium]
MSTPSPHLSLGRRLAARLFPVAVGIAMVISLGIPMTYYAIESATLHRTAVRNARELADQLESFAIQTPTLWKHQAAKYVQVATHFLAEKDVTSIRVYDETRRPVTMYGHESAEANRWWNRIAPQGIAPIHYNNRQIGEVRVEISLGRFLGVTLALFALSSMLGIALATIVYRLPAKIIGGMEGQIEDLVQTVRQERDESERFKLEAEAAARRFRELVQGLDAIVWEVDPSTLRCSFVSERAEAILGYPAEQWLTEADFWVAHLHADDREQAIAVHRQIGTDGGAYTCEYRMFAADGRAVWMYDAGNLVRAPGGEETRLLGVMVDVTVRKHAEEALRTHTTQLEAVRALAAEIVQELDLERLLDLITRRAAEVVGAPAGTIFLWDESTQQHVPRGWHGPSVEGERVPRRVGEGLVGLVAERREGFLVNDYRAWPGASPVVLAVTPITAAIAEPLIYRGRLIGTLVFNDFGTGRKFSEEDRTFLALFATQAAIAIENARLHERLTIRLKSQQALTRLSQIISASLDMDAVLREIAHAAQELVGGSLVTFWTVDETSRTLTPRAYSDTAILDYPQESLRFGEGGVGWVAEHRQPLIVSDRYADPRFFAQAWARKNGFVSFLGIPVILGETLLAVLALNARQPFHLTPDEQSLLDSFVAQVAIALENARLYDAAQRELADRTRAEAALRESERQLALAIAGSGIGLWDWRVQTGEVLFNDRWAEILGYTLAELAPISVQTRITLCHPEDLAKSNALLQKHFVGESAAYECEARMRHKDGHWVWVLDRGTVTERDREGKPLRMTGTHLDITTRKQLEEERLVRSKLEATGILAGGIAHDFNNLLSVILGSLELMKLPVGDIAPHLEAAEQATMAAHELTQQFLTFARGGGSVRRKVALGGVLRDAVALALRGSPVECDLALPPDLWPIEGDVGQLGQAIRNLVLNAREALPAGGRVVLRAENLSGPTPAVRVTVADRGCGIPADILPRIFDPYFSTKQRGEQRGMGLGLTVARAVVEKHGGTIAVDSAAGAGTTVRIEFPAAQPAASVSPPPAPEPRPTSARLLLMDDEPALRNTAGALLQHLGYAVEMAEHGERAIGMYREAQRHGHPFDVVILDLTVRGGMGGVETLRALRQLSPAVKAIASSGYADDPVLLDPVRHGFCGALAKPYRLTELQMSLAKVLEP